MGDVPEIQLLEPKDAIKRFNDFWYKAEERCTKLFYNGKEENIDKLVPGIQYFKSSDDVLSVMFSRIRSRDSGHLSIGIRSAVILLDAIYHTRLDNPTAIALKLCQYSDEGLLNRIIDVNNPSDKEAEKCVDIIACAGKCIHDNLQYKYCYSFATKFCSWLNPEAFYIYDSMAASLLKYYVDLKIDCEVCKELPKNKKGKLDVESLGNYRTYIEVYRSFIELYGLENSFTTKQIDVFLWIYGKALQMKQNKNKRKANKGSDQTAEQYLTIISPKYRELNKAVYD